MHQCDLCDQPATVYLTQIVNGQMKKVNLCGKCSKEKGVTDPTGFQLADLLLGIGEEKEIAPPAGKEKAAGKGSPGLTCPSCGFTQTDLKQKGRLGCPECYQTFGEGLTGLLKAMHKGTRHVGKIPQRLGKAIKLERDLRSLRDQLEKAVAEEDYEEAAKVRDEIRKAESTAKKAPEEKGAAKP
jgi:protein arginine kinase activator